MWLPFEEGILFLEFDIRETSRIFARHVWNLAVLCVLWRDEAEGASRVGEKTLLILDRSGRIRPLSKGEKLSEVVHHEWNAREINDTYKIKFEDIVTKNSPSFVFFN